MTEDALTDEIRAIHRGERCFDCGEPIERGDPCGACAEKRELLRQAFPKLHGDA